MEGFFLLKSPVFLNYEQNLIYLNLKLKIQPQFPKLYLNMVNYFIHIDVKEILHEVMVLERIEIQRTSISSRLPQQME